MKLDFFSWMLGMFMPRCTWGPIIDFLDKVDEWWEGSDND